MISGFERHPTGYVQVERDWVGPVSVGPVSAGLVSFGPISLGRVSVRRISVGPATSGRVRGLLFVALVVFAGSACSARTEAQLSVPAAAIISNGGP